MTGDKLALKYGFVPKEAPLSNWPSKDTKFLVDPELKEIGKFVIFKFKQELQNMNIGYVFKQKASKNGEMTTLGQAKTESDLQKVLHGLDALIIIGFDTWVTMELDEKLALIHHELCHIGRHMDTGKTITLPHTVEEFPEIMQAWGPRTDSQIEFIAAYKKFSADHGSPTT